MLLQKERNSIIEYGKKLVENRLTKGTGGNLSVFDPASGLMVISPSGIDYAEIKPEQVAVLKVETGEQVEGQPKPPVKWRCTGFYTLIVRISGQ